jgi:hypothetical protein
LQIKWDYKKNVLVKYRIINMLCLFVTPADDARVGMAAGKLREAAARGNLQEVLRLVEDGAKIQTDEVSSVSCL